MTVDEDVSNFASLFQRFLQHMTEAGWEQRPSELRTLIDRHLRTESTGLPVVAQSFMPFDHANVQVALKAYLSEQGATHEILGLSGQSRHFGSFADLLDMGPHTGVRVGKPDLVDLPVGPDETLACVQFGLFLIARGDERLAVLVRGPDEHGQNQGVMLEVLSPDPESARSFLAEIRRLIVELKVLGIGEHKDRLRSGGQHVKRGALLHGPPGNGKTHTVRYLVSRMVGTTVLLLTGGGLHMVRQACALARMLEPSLVVLEDIDLIAQDRGVMGRFGNPLLFDVLNEMDGMAEDADVAFVLTTNRADVLEPALAARPGRVDLAVQIPLPDEDARRGLLELYGRGLEVRLTNVDSIVGRTSGVTAAFIKELVRKAALLAANRSAGEERIRVSDEDFTGSLDDLLAERSALTRVLLGGAQDESRVPGPRDWLFAE